MKRLPKGQKAQVMGTRTFQTMYTAEQMRKFAAREWVGLTDEETEDIWNRYCDELGEASINDAIDISRAIETKLREKNT